MHFDERLISFDTNSVNFHLNNALNKITAHHRKAKMSDDDIKKRDDYRFIYSLLSAPDQSLPVPENLELPYLPLHQLVIPTASPAPIDKPVLGPATAAVAKRKTTAELKTLLEERHGKITSLANKLIQNGAQQITAGHVTGYPDNIVSDLIVEFQTTRESSQSAIEEIKKAMPVSPHKH